MARLIGNISYITAAEAATELETTLTRVLIPLAFVAAIVLLATGVIQNLTGFQTVQTLTGGHATILC